MLALATTSAVGTGGSGSWAKGSAAQAGRGLALVVTLRCGREWRSGKKGGVASSGRVTEP